MTQIKNIILAVDPSTVHGHFHKDVKTIFTYVLKPFSLNFNNCLNSCVFPDEWKKANIVPTHKKVAKILIAINQG